MIQIFALLVLAANDVPVPTACTPAVNAHLAQLVHATTKHTVDNVMVCGIATANSTTQSGGPHGDHQIISINVVFTPKESKLVEVVTNDALDGKVTAAAKSVVFAYGQAFFDQGTKFVAGIHDVHCSTHSGADNGWVVVQGKKFPSAACVAKPPKTRHRPRR